MARKKAKVSSKKYIKEGDHGSGVGSDDANIAGGASATAAPPPPPPPPPPVVGCAGGENSALKGVVVLAAPVNDRTSTEKALMDSFYEKLVKLHQSSGLSVVFNFRETKVDLYLLYRKVTEKGGFHQVSKEGKWNEVASAVNLKIQVSLLPAQVKKVYESLLFQYEQMHYYRTPAKFYITQDYGNRSECSLVRQKSCLNSSHDGQETRESVLDTNRASTDYGNCSKCSLGKRKPCDSPSHEDQGAKKGTLDINRASTGPGTSEQKPNVHIHFDYKDIKDLQLPLKPRTSYQIFVRTECDRLKKLHGESSSNVSYRNMATEAWRHLSQTDRLPYIEASKKDKERFNRDMVVYEQIWNQKIAKKQKVLNNSTQSIINFGATSPADDGYYVTLEADAGNFTVPDESMVESTVQILKDTRPTDPIFQINWDGCCGSPDS